ncbi:MAG: cobyric acid synthase, partial [Alicyclobacillus sp.]|nr:cobyric acid synthase [Alicyclobacillus sp.]
FDEGVRLLEQYAGVPVLGVIPYIPDLGIEEEDSVALEDTRYRQSGWSHQEQGQLPGGGPDDLGEGVCEGDVRIAIVQLPHISNFTDFDPLFLEPGVHVRFCRRPEEMGEPHAVILPGTKNTMEDLRWLHESGFANAVAECRRSGAWVFGICGGYQMLGQEVRDPGGHESSTPTQEGLGWLPVTTTLLSHKTTVRVRGRLEGMFAPIPVSGYEIHMGQTSALDGYRPFAAVCEEEPRACREPGAGHPGPAPLLRPDGAVSSDGAVMGTYLHGIFDNDAFRRAWLGRLRDRFGLPDLPPSDLTMSHRRAAALDRLAAVVREHLAVRRVYDILGLAAGRSHHRDTL